jgi:hypothetical protein
LPGSTMLQILKTDSIGFFARSGKVSAYLQNTFKKTLVFRPGNL